MVSDRPVEQRFTIDFWGAGVRSVQDFDGIQLIERALSEYE
jgi:hypothetical protein